MQMCQMLDLQIWLPASPAHFSGQECDSGSSAISGRLGIQEKEREKQLRSIFPPHFNSQFHCQDRKHTIMCKINKVTVKRLKKKGLIHHFTDCINVVLWWQQVYLVPSTTFGKKNLFEVNCCKKTIFQRTCIVQTEGGLDEAMVGISCLYTKGGNGALEKSLQVCLDKLSKVVTIVALLRVPFIQKKTSSHSNHCSQVQKTSWQIWLGF